jgi:hypothetical protein
MGLVVAAGLVAAEDKQARNSASKGGSAEKVSGVILKLEPVAVGAPGKDSWRLVINTDVVWRDFVRDQATEPAKAARTEPAIAARKGKESVATEGYPKNADLLVMITVDPRTEITMRYRSSTDSIGEGSPTAEGAAKAEAIASAPSGGKTPEVPEGSRGRGRKARNLDPSELKPGLWLDVEFRKADNWNQARRVTVMRPVGGPDTSPEQSKAATALGR